LKQDPSAEVIKRRSENAEAALGWLFSAYDWFWILVGAAFLIALGIYQVIS
jgi:hypothetical protein